MLSKETEAQRWWLTVPRSSSWRELALNSHSTTASNPVHFFKDVKGKRVLYTYKITLVFSPSTFKKHLPILPKS